MSSSVTENKATHQWQSMQRMRCGRARMQPSAPSAWLATDDALSSASIPPTTLQLLSENADRLAKISSAWMRRDYTVLLRLLQQCDDYFDPEQPHLLTYFVGLGGVDLFVRILCEPSADTAPRVGNRRLVSSLIEVTRILTELLICHNELSWYLYHQYPGVVFRLLELITIRDISRTATTMLEHFVSSVGPVLEIARTPLLAELLRSPDDNTLANICRVVALLLVPGLALAQSPFPSRHLVYPESLLPLRRVQRVIDSNVLWLSSEKGLVDRMIKLCELRARGIRVQDGNRTMTLFSHLMIPRPAADGAGQAAESEWDEEDEEMEEEEEGEWVDDEEQQGEEEEGLGPNIYAEPRVEAPYMPPRPPSLNTLPSTFQQMLEALAAEREGGSNNWDMLLNRLPFVNDLQQRLVPMGGMPAPTPPATPMQPPLPPTNNNNNNNNLNTIIQDLVDEAMMNSAQAAAGSSTVNFSWIFGTADCKQSWRVKDLTIVPAFDDNRPQLYYGQSQNPVQDFQAANRTDLRNLQPLPGASSRYGPDMENGVGQQNTVDSQSEILFVLNVMLSNFYFSDVWHEMKRCRWIPRANKIYNAAFGLDADQPLMVELPPQIRLSEELRNMPRFQPPRSAGVSDGEGSLAPARGRNSSGSSSGSPAVPTPHHLFPEKWLLPSDYFDMLGHDKEDFSKDFSTSTLIDADEFLEDKAHQHGPDTIRKLELLRGILEFWNAQDRLECSLLQDALLPKCSLMLAKKIANTLAACKEDTCVETAACHTLEGFLRTFSFFKREQRCLKDSPQSAVGALLMKSMLENRIYNATRVPGLPGSLKPAKRVDAVFALVAECVRYHFDNMTLLSKYVRGAMPLLHLNELRGNTNRAHSVVHSTDEEAIEAILKDPPLERGEEEEFGAVLLRRVFQYGCDANLFVRSLVVSLTPGLRSEHNYVHKSHPLDMTVPVDMPADSPSRLADGVCGYPVRLTQTRSISRRYTAAISDAVAASSGNGGDGHAAVTTQLLTEAFEALTHTAHRLSLPERTFPDLFNAEDYAVLRGERQAPLPGPPTAWRMRLFDNGSGDAENLQELSALSDYLLAEPHKLVYSLLCPLSAERMDNTSRLCVVTSSLLIFMREAQLRGGGLERAVHTVLDSIKPLARRANEAWREKNEAVSATTATAAVSTMVCSCPSRSKSKIPFSGDPTHRCPSFVHCGSCHPTNSMKVYHRRYGGCFFRNFFRLLCVWVSHYSACQRYVETLFFCTEVAFAEYKSVVLTLFRALPQYFMPSLPAD